MSDHNHSEHDLLLHQLESLEFDRGVVAVGLLYKLRDLGYLDKAQHSTDAQLMHIWAIFVEYEKKIAELDEFMRLVAD